MSAIDGDIPAVVKRRFPLFERGLVFFVDDDEAQVFHRRKNRRTCADEHAGASASHVHPSVEAFSRRKMAVPDDDLGAAIAEAHAEAFDGLGRQRDFRYEIIVDIDGFKWMIQTTDYVSPDSTIGIYIEPDAIHVMKKSEFSGMFGDYSTFSDEMDHLGDPLEEEAE